MLYLNGSLGFVGNVSWATVCGAGRQGRGERAMPQLDGPWARGRPAYARRAAALTPMRPHPVRTASTWRMAKGQPGVFTPVVVAARTILGKERFEKLRGKGIALHSQAITNFCKFAGVEGKMRQNLIRMAKANGGKLGFLS